MLLPHVGNTNTDYYSASCGLFFVIEDRYGRASIKEIMRNINERGRCDGAAVTAIVNRVLDTDIVKLVEEFRFPETGLYMNSYEPGGYIASTLPDPHPEEGLLVLLVGPDSPARRAGMRKGDVVTGLNGTHTVTNLDFEMALFQRMQEKSIALELWREGSGEMIVQLQLAA